MKCKIHGCQNETELDNGYCLRCDSIMQDVLIDGDSESEEDEDVED